MSSGACQWTRELFCLLSSPPMPSSTLTLLYSHRSSCLRIRFLAISIFKGFMVPLRRLKFEQLCHSGAYVTYALISPRRRHLSMDVPLGARVGPYKSIFHSESGHETIKFISLVGQQSSCIRLGIPGWHKDTPKKVRTSSLRNTVLESDSCHSNTQATSSP